jgi:hypothetical protein
MAQCPKCGSKNDSDAVFCTHCRTPLKTAAVRSSLEKQTKKFAKDMEQMGRKTGDAMARSAKQMQQESKEMGRRVEQRIDQVTKHTESWYDRRFGIFGPLISSFVGLIVLRVAIEVMKISGTDVQMFSDLSSILLTYLFLVFCLLLLSSYTTYFSKKYQVCRWISPFSAAVVIVGFSWIVVRILSYVGSRHHELSSFVNVASTTERYLPTIFVFILIVGYLVLIVLQEEKHFRKER